MFLRLTKNRTLTPLAAKGHRIVGQAIAKQANPQPIGRLRPSGPFFDRRPEAGASVERDPVR